jgi:hypothetical protein
MTNKERRMMAKFRLATLIGSACLAMTSLIGAQSLGSVSSPSNGLTAAQIQQFTQQDSALVPLMDPPLDPTLDPPGHFHSVSPHVYDPGDTDSVQAKWLKGIGCGNAIATHGTSYQDSVCTTGDLNDEENDGLLLAKTGPTAQNSSAFAELHNANGIVLTELGYDIRLLQYPTNVSGSHCGAGAPRFNVYTTDGLFFVGCRSPLANSVTAGIPGTGDAWTRLRWGLNNVVMGFSASTFALVPITGTVQRIFVVFDEGSDTGADFFGAAVLDNIDVNGQLVGKE